VNIYFFNFFLLADWPAASLVVYKELHGDLLLASMIPHSLKVDCLPEHNLSLSLTVLF